MAIYGKFPDETPFKPDKYLAEITAVETRDSQFGPSLLLTFVVTSPGQFQGRTLTKMVKNNLSQSAALGTIYRTLCGERPANTKVDVEADLVGKECEIWVKPEQKDGKTFNKITDVFAVDGANLAIA